jgi:hypothetical protein
LLHTFNPEGTNALSLKHPQRCNNQHSLTGARARTPQLKTCIVRLDTREAQLEKHERELRRRCTKNVNRHAVLPEFSGPSVLPLPRFVK